MMANIDDKLEDLNREERQTWITEQVLREGTVYVDNLAEIFDVSRMTIHRDLDDLEHQGVLQKIRNGATAQPTSLFESDIRYRENLAVREKEALADFALRYIEPGQSILLDEATTLLPLMRKLEALAPLTVITNFLPMIEELSTMKDIRLIALGGEFLPRFSTFTGLICQQAVANLNADVLFTSTTAIAGLEAFHPEQQIVAVKQMMMASAQRRYLLVDHNKFNKTALHKVASLKDFDAVIVDSGIDQQTLIRLQEGGVPVEIAHIS